MVVIVVNCPAVVDAVTIIPSLVLMVVARMPSMLPPSTGASIDNN